MAGKGREPRKPPKQRVRPRKPGRPPPKKPEAKVQPRKSPPLKLPLKPKNLRLRKLPRQKLRDPLTSIIPHFIKKVNT